MLKLNFTPDKITKGNTVDLHTALTKLKLNIDNSEITAKNIGDSTINAIKEVQKRNKLPATGKINDKTLNIINLELFDTHYTLNKTRTEKLHVLLHKVGLPISQDEQTKRITGESTRQAIEIFQKKEGLPVDGKLNEAVLNKLEEESIKKTYSTKTQIGKLQNTILRAAKIAKLPVEISQDELTKKVLGKTSSDAIKAIQTKYNLPQTGVIDKITLERIQSIAVSKGITPKPLKTYAAKELSVITSNLRLNMKSPKVEVMQKALAHLGYPIADKEFKTQTFGKTTRKAVIAFQKSNGLAETGHMEADTLKFLNNKIARVNPIAETSQMKYKVRGSVRDEVLQAKGNMVIHIYEKLLDGQSDKPLATMKNHPNGFFDITYTPPIDENTGKVKEKYHLLIKLLDDKDNELNPPQVQLHHDVPRILWVNFNLGGQSYAGDSDFSGSMKILSKALGKTNIMDIKETPATKQVTQLSIDTGLDVDNIMRLILSHRVATNIKIGHPDVELDAEVFYAFIEQNIPPSLPGDILRGTNEWTDIDKMTENTTNDIVFSDNELLEQTLNNAIALNIVSQKIKQNKTQILEALQKLHTSFVLEKPILTGNGNIKSLLDKSSVNKNDYSKIANAFILNRGINSDFWNTLKDANSGIDLASLKDLEITVNVGNVAKNHIPTVEFIKSYIGTGNTLTTPNGNIQLNRVGDIAKLSHTDWVSLVNSNPNPDKIPDNLPGDNKIEVYANILKTRAEALFPGVAFVTASKNNLIAANKVETFYDNNPDFNIKLHNLDKYLSDNKDNPDAKIDDSNAKTEIKLIARIGKLAPDAVTGQVMVEEKLHNSSQIYLMGKTKLTNLFKDRGIASKIAAGLYEQAKTRHLQILARWTEFHPAINFGTPRAIISQTYATEEIKEAVGDIPDLEQLFGSLDYCECEHCKSLYGPAAYFTDLLRFLNKHNSLVPKTSNTFLSAKDILFTRRPDLGNIKLNCENTNIPLPYIDLVCEILEHNIDPLDKNFSYQTTHTADELRAMPEYIRPGAYDVLAQAKYPMSMSFNLWQEEARINLDYLRVPRYELMEAFQDISDPSNKVPGDMAIAAEYFGISSQEAAIITTQLDLSQPTGKAELQKYWGDTSKLWSTLTPDNEGIDINTTKIPVNLLLNRCGLAYNELLELLMVRFINDPSSPAIKSEIERPVDTCDTKVQMVTNLTPAKFDLINRFLRLWRKTGWAMWELDLLIRNPKIGQAQINHNTLVNLKKFNQLQEKLSLPFEVLLAFYGDINTEPRVKPDKPGVKIKPLYEQLFQNSAIVNPLDPHFTRPLDTAIIFDINPNAPYNGYNPTPVILASLAIKKVDFDILCDIFKKKFSLSSVSLSDTSLSFILRYTYLAKGLKLRIKDLQLLLDITKETDPFSSSETTKEFIKKFEMIQNSGLSLLELDYVLNYNSESSIGLRDESIVTYLKTLRNILITNNAQIDKLSLDDTKIATILAIDTVALGTQSDTQFLNTIQPLQDMIKSVFEAFKTNSFSVEEAQYIIQFDLAIPTFNKVTMSEKIKKLQDNIKTLLKQNNDQIISHISSTFALTDQQSEFLLNNLILTGQTKKLIEILSDKSLIATNPDGSYKDITKTNFLLYFNVYILLHKISILIQRMNPDIKDLKYYQINNVPLKTLDLATLPVVSTTTNSFDKWLNLYKFLDFTSKYPEPEDSSLRQILDKAKDTSLTDTTAKPAMYGLIEKLTHWDKTDIERLDSAFKLKHDPSLIPPKLDYTDAELYHRFQKCFAQIKLTGVNADTMLTWANTSNPTIQQNIADQTRLAIKSKYEKENWLEKIKPLQNELRERKRKALVLYLIENSQRTQTKEIIFNGDKIPNPLYWHDYNSLYKYFLIDVEMSSCQLTSRIKQGISSVQMFVQRCFLNLENRYIQVGQAAKEDTASENAWSQWKWMKNYRIWEANRKVFFYPENWIEPELRDDKSQFFKELEDEIMQNEITHDNVEAAYLNYLHKVDEVSHLEVCGLYHEMEELNPDELGYEINNVHVIARTKSVPAIYYYRKYDMNYSTWTAWEKIDLDITGDQVVPVVYNRKLHLFWFVFMEKPQKQHKVPVPDIKPGNTDTPEPQKTLEIQLAWSVKKEKGWAPKKISKRKLIHPWERPHYSYNLKPFYKSVTNELWLDIYLSTSKEFNDRQFYDQFTNRIDYVTGNRFNETYLPWHSASFVFNGDITDVKLKGLGGHFHLDILGIDLDIWLPTDSYTYVHNNFGIDGQNIKELQPQEFGPRLGLPTGMHYHNTHLTNNQRDNRNDNELRVLENHHGSPAMATLLKNAINPFELVITQQDLQLDTFNTDHPIFYQDNQRAFFIKPEWQTLLDNYGQTIGRTRQYRALPFYHPYTTLFIRELNRSGIDGLLNRKIQIKPATYVPVNNFNFSSYNPTPIIIADDTVKKDIVDFSFSGAYSIYNWEIFFHAPMMLATKLTQNQRFEEAMRWFHYIFDPTNIEDLPTPNRYWVTKPFYDTNSDEYRKERIENILSNISENKGQLIAWRNNPFKPHLIARYRPVAYQRNVVMKYLDNLIAWGDQLFRRDTIESINEASLLYMLAYEILGRRPEKVPNVNHEDLSFNDIEANLDDFGNTKVPAIEDTLMPIKVIPSLDGTDPIPNIDTFYFCIPNNDKLLGYWDTVEDRLFKIRHCMNIEGVVRQLPLFEPPIDPALLVKAAAAGIDIGSVLNDITAGTPHYRFRVVVQKAVEFCSEVKSLGEKLLSALEKKDVEALTLLRSQHELELLEAIKEIRKQQIDEAVNTIGSLQKTQEMAEQKKTYYEGIPRMNGWEIGGVVSHGAGIVSEVVATVANTLAAGVYLIPQFPVGAAGVGGSPTALVEFGGEQAGKSAAKFAALFQGLSTIAHSIGSLLETQGSYTRRDEENQHQLKLATIEITQLQFQINAAEIRQAIAEKELDNQELQIDNAKTVDEYMRNKYTNEQLYNWMITQISTVYFQAYQLAFDMAKKAEKCYQYELGIQNSSYIQFGYWDSLKKGLLSGDKLIHDLHKLEAAYIDQNKRELEITKHISLAQIDPLNLLKLKETGKCTISLPEWLFNMDYPGHYMRRIKSVSISIPCIAGPHTSVNCTLSLLKSEVRNKSILSGGYNKTDENDTRFISQYGSIPAIATSHAQNDSGMFELNFNDDRYLPFEGLGVISDWEISMPKENNYFDFSSISDLILHISYTARDGGAVLATEANKELQKILPDSAVRLFSLKHEFSTEWYKFFNPVNNQEQELIINLAPEHYPFFLRGKINTLKFKKLELFIESNDKTIQNFEALMQITDTAYETTVSDISPDPNYGDISHDESRDYSSSTKPKISGEIKMKLKVKNATGFKSLSPDTIKDMFLLCHIAK